LEKLANIGKRVYLCLKITKYMKKFAPYYGLTLIIIGVVTLTATRLRTFSSNNWLLVTGLLLIIAGIVLHVRHIKRQSEY